MLINAKQLKAAIYPAMSILPSPNRNVMVTSHRCHW